MIGVLFGSIVEKSINILIEQEGFLLFQYLKVGSAFYYSIVISSLLYAVNKKNVINLYKNKFSKTKIFLIIMLFNVLYYVLKIGFLYDIYFDHKPLVYLLGSLLLWFGVLLSIFLLIKKDILKKISQTFNVLMGILISVLVLKLISYGVDYVILDFVDGAPSNFSVFLKIIKNAVFYALIIPIFIYLMEYFEQS